MFRSQRTLGRFRKVITGVSEFSSAKTVKLDPYLYFYGNAAQARDFYAEKFNGKVLFSSYFKDNADCKVAEDRKNWLMHASVQFGDNTIMMCDDASNTSHTIATNVTLCVSYTDVKEMTKVFNGLAQGGTIQVPLAKQFWDATYGKLQDKFGVIWAFNCDHSTDSAKKN